MRVANLSLFKKLIIYNITIDRCIQLSLSTFHGTIRYLESETSIYDTEWHRTRNGDFSDSALVLVFARGLVWGVFICRFHKHTISAIMPILASKALLCENKKSSDKMLLLVRIEPSLQFQVQHSPFRTKNWAFACKTETLGSLYSHTLIIPTK